MSPSGGRVATATRHHGDISIELSGGHSHRVPTRRNLPVDAFPVWCCPTAVLKSKTLPCFRSAMSRPRVTFGVLAIAFTLASPLQAQKVPVVEKTQIGRASCRERV